tara:strand:- start:152 stop:580 length:429 start_codon:yes stop_codon:yes gene_type:complete
MTDSNFTPEYNNEPVPGTEVTEQPGLYPENIAPDTPDGTTNVPYTENGAPPYHPVSEDPNVVITTGDTGTYSVPPHYDAPVEDPRVDHVISLLEELNQKVEHLMEHAHSTPDCCPPPEPPVVYEGMVTLQPVPQGPPPEYQN